jgi:hypothetical protein
MMRRISSSRYWQRRPFFAPPASDERSVVSTELRECLGLSGMRREKII